MNSSNKTTSQHAFSLFARLFVLDIACFIMSLFVFTISSNVWLRAVIQLCDLILLISVIYSYVYKIGEYDATLVNSGYKPAEPLRGLFVGLIANIPFFVTAFLLVLSRLGVFGANFYNYYKILNSFFFPFIYTLLPVDMSIFEVRTLDVVLTVLIQIVVPIISFFAYQIGLSRFSFKEKLFYKKAE